MTVRQTTETKYRHVDSQQQQQQQRRRCQNGSGARLESGVRDDGTSWMHARRLRTVANTLAD